MRSLSSLGYLSVVGASLLTHTPLWLIPAGAWAAHTIYEETPPETRAALAAQVRALPGADRAARLVSAVRERLPIKALPAPESDAWGDDPLPTLSAARPVASAAPSRAAQIDAPARPRWIEVVNDNPDLAPHALILGGSGVGKTTMATAIMGDRGGRTVVLSPKVSAGGWAGAEVISLDDDGSYLPIVAALQDLEDEKRRRIVMLRKLGPDALEPLTIVMDELVDLTAREPKAGELMVNLSSIGREIKMRLIGIGTTDKALGIKGWASSRNNYVTISIDERRRATITHGTSSFSAASGDALALASGVALRAWRGGSIVSTAPAAPDDLLAGLLAQADDGASADDRERLRVARSLAPKIGKTRAIKVVWPDATSSAKYQRYAALVDATD